jgi:hypothetical protein
MASRPKVSPFPRPNEGGLENWPDLSLTTQKGRVLFFLRKAR